MRNYRGDFEVHVTVRAPDGPGLARFQEWCRQHGCKCVWIVLARGEHAQQPMATWRRRDTTLSSVLEEAQHHAAELDRAVLLVERLKIEADPHNEDVPAHDADAAAHPRSNYFEHHIKLLRDKAATCEALVEVCEPCGAHLSRNAFREVQSGKEERFVTLRSYGVGRATSERQLQQLLAALQALDEQILEHESEYCVYDSNLTLDAGWLPRAGQPAFPQGSV